LNFFRKIINKIRKQDHLGAYIISRKPIILVSFWFDFLNNLEDIKAVLPADKNVHFIFKIGFYKSSKDAAEIKTTIKELNQKHSNYNFNFLANSPEELENFQENGLNTLFCNQNAFLDENKYKINNKKPRYKAIYMARITPLKRYELATKVDNLFVIGSWKDAEVEYAKNILKKCDPEKWIKRIPHFMVSKYMNQAQSGLALSKIEGTMYVCTEYLLSGLPVVSSKSQGGRHIYFDDRYVTIAEDTPESVAEKVEEITSRDMDRKMIRENTINIMQNHRKKFIELINSIYKSEGVDRNFGNEWEDVFTHKLGLRMHVPRKIYKKRMLKKGMNL